MTTYAAETVDCLACGGSSKQRLFTSTSSFGPSDLDTRPAQPARSALSLSIQECPHCGYCAARINAGDPFVARIVEDQAYQRLRRAPHPTGLVRRYRCSAWILAICNDDGAAGWASLSAAWACDDAGDELAACIDRAAAVESFLAAQDEDEEFAADRATEAAIIADLLRCSHQFDRAEQQYRDALEVATDPQLRAILDYGMRRTEQGDAAAHPVTEATDSIC